jgi:hypothetical protein
VFYDGVAIDRKLSLDYFTTPVDAFLGTFSNNGDVQTDALIGSVSCLDIYDNTTQVMKLRPISQGMVVDGKTAEADGFYDYVQKAFFSNDGDGDLEYVPADTKMSVMVDGQSCDELKILNNTQLECVVPAYTGYQPGEVPVNVALALLDKDGSTLAVASKENGYTYLGDDVVVEVPNTGDETVPSASFGSTKAKYNSTISVALGMVLTSSALWIYIEKRFKKV